MRSVDAMSRAKSKLLKHVQLTRCKRQRQSLERMAISPHGSLVLVYSSFFEIQIGRQRTRHTGRNRCERAAGCYGSDIEIL